MGRRTEEVGTRSRHRVSGSRFHDDGKIYSQSGTRESWRPIQCISVPVGARSYVYASTKRAEQRYSRRVSRLSSDVDHFASVSDGADGKAAWSIDCSIPLSRNPTGVDVTCPEGR